MIVFVVVVALLLVLVLGVVMFTDVLDGKGSLSRGLKNVVAQLRRDIRLLGHR
ncbi:hypothetical protein AB0L88_05240 [Saccharopolyspora shandongensis]|uniref:Uncharacterized protein n=1 Tax=Saccharopolyspora shandongensis TaxID=418495 RepID=A0A1H3GYG2_9PSEU|nr:hypothetical protein [Saccharopolyspora shandongensis]SDY07678.1 hypothetical protein SAMN05216215_1019118 [Saccharopolyspora shandongensis]